MSKETISCYTISFNFFMIGIFCNTKLINDAAHSSICISLMMNNIDSRRGDVECGKPITTISSSRPIMERTWTKSCRTFWLTSVTNDYLKKARCIMIRGSDTSVF